MEDVVVVGGGIAAVSFIATMVQQPVRPKSVTIIAQEGFGFSPNFFDQPQSSLCNTSVGVNSLVYSDPDHFRRWLELRDHVVDDMDCVPRALYGQYLKDVADYMIARMRFLGIKCTVVRETFVSLTERAGTKIIATTEGRAISASRVVFCLGHNYRQSKGDRYLCYPEHQAEIQALDDGVREVVVLGTRLSAIDAALLVKDKPNLKIRFLSRTGYFPAVRNGLPPGRLDVVNATTVTGYAQQRGIGMYAALILAIRDEVARHSSRDLCTIDPDANAQFVIDAENSKSPEVINWQYALDNIMFLVNSVWHQLDTSEQKRFLRENEAMMKRYLYSMPERTSKILREKIEAGEFALETRSIVDIEALPSGDFRLHYASQGEGNGDSEVVPFVIDASGLHKKLLYVQRDGSLALERSQAPLAFDCGSFTSRDIPGVHCIGSMVTSLPIVNYIRMIASHAHALCADIANHGYSAAAINPMRQASN